MIVKSTKNRVEKQKKKKEKVVSTGEFEEKERDRRIKALLEERELAFAEEEKQLFSWKAPARPYKVRNREYFTTVGAMVLLVCVILLFAREFLLVAVVLAFSFLVYVLASIEPGEVKHEVSTRGIRTGGKFFRWDVLGRFWFEEKFGQKMLVVETGLAFPSRLVMLLGKTKKEELQKILSRYLLNETPEESWTDKLAKWLVEKVPLDQG